MYQSYDQNQDSVKMNASSSVLFLTPRFSIDDSVTDMLAVQLSDVNQLTSSLNLVVRDDVEMKCSSTGNVGWAADVVDDWNAGELPLTSTQSHTSPFQLANSLLQCGMFCTSVFISFF